MYKRWCFVMFCQELEMLTLGRQIATIISEKWSHIVDSLNIIIWLYYCSSTIQKLKIVTSMKNTLSPWSSLKICNDPNFNRFSFCEKKVSSWVAMEVFYNSFRNLNPIKNGLFQGCITMGVGVCDVGKSIALFKICHTNPTMIKLGRVIPYLKKVKK